MIEINKKQELAKKDFENAKRKYLDKKNKNLTMTKVFSVKMKRLSKGIFSLV